MPGLSTVGVVSAITPSVIETYFIHYLNRKPRKNKPTAHITYDEGLRLIREFLDYSSKHTVEDLQLFTSQWVPVPTWVRTYNNEIAPQFLERAARVIRSQLGPKGVQKIGGGTWWQWRRPESPLRAEWIEMKKDFNERKKAGTRCDRCILYVHGGAYYFGSVDEHRYQMQRHARKLKARILAPRYRLAPQFPFPCGLMDCIATYFYLLEHFRPEQVLIAGDSAGGAMVMSMLVILRDQGSPLPAGTILLSPWVDLTHSFPSCSGDGAGDYIPPHGFHHKPSMAWPPPPLDAVKTLENKVEYIESRENAVELPATANIGIQAARPSGIDLGSLISQANNTLPGLGDNLSITVDGKEVEVKEQIQLYAPNHLLTHPLVSPVLQPSLGGLPPMLIQTGGAELVRDEQIYLAHKAANPKAFPPGDAILDEYDPRRELIERYPPTNVQLQVWDDLCHVPHTLSFTRPAKYMYRSVAQFGAWALAHAQHVGIEIPDDDAISIISSGDEDEADDDTASTLDPRRRKTNKKKEPSTNMKTPLGAVGRAGDPLPPFKNHMIRQRVTRHGDIFPLAPESEMACLALDPATIGAIKPGPVRKWLAKKKENTARFGSEEKKIQKKRAKELAAGYDDVPGESPPLTALVRRRRKGAVPEEKERGKSWGLTMWSGWGSSHDQHTLEREEKTEKEAQRKESDLGRLGESTPHLVQSHVPVSEQRAASKRRMSNTSAFSTARSFQDVSRERTRSPYRQVMDVGQAGNDQLFRTPTGFSVADGSSAPEVVERSVPTAGEVATRSLRVPGSQNTYLEPGASRPHDGIAAYPFKLKQGVRSSSVTTLDSAQPSSSTSHAEAPGVVPVEMPTNEHAMPHAPLEKEAEPVSYNRLAEAFSAVSPVSDSSLPSPTAEPVSAITPSVDAMYPLRRLETSGERATPASPIEDADMTPTASTAQGHEAIFNNRSSVLGKIGADGMPLSPLMAQQALTHRKLHSSLSIIPSESARSSTVEGDEPSPITPMDEHKGALSKLSAQAQPLGLASAAFDLGLKDDEASPITPIDGDKPPPFKIRNPVYDARATRTSITTSQDASAKNSLDISQAGTRLSDATDVTKAAPFKLRHTVYDPSAASDATEASESPAASAAAATDADHSHARAVADRAMTPIMEPQAPEAMDLPPNANVVMPTIVSRRPMALRQNTPSPPPRVPPKDSSRGYGAGMDRKRSKELLRGDVKTASPVQQERAKSRLEGVPVIGDFSFENKKGFDLDAR